jgi:hypothetical protein
VQVDDYDHVEIKYKIMPKLKKEMKKQSLYSFIFLDLFANVVHILIL